MHRLQGLVDVLSKSARCCSIAIDVLDGFLLSPVGLLRPFLLSY